VDFGEPEDSAGSRRRLRASGNFERTHSVANFFSDVFVDGARSLRNIGHHFRRQLTTNATNETYATVVYQIRYQASSLDGALAAETALATLNTYIEGSPDSAPEALRALVAAFQSGGATVKVSTFTTELKNFYDNSAAVTAAKGAAAAVTAVVAAAVGASVGASVGAGSAGGAAGGASGAGMGGAIALLGQVQFTALSSQSNAPLPETFSAFNGGFAWANLQFDYSMFKGESCTPTLKYNEQPTASAAQSASDVAELGSQIGVKSDAVDGTQAFLATKGVTAGENFAGNAFSMFLVIASMLAFHSMAIYYYGKNKLGGMLAFPKLEIIVATAFFQGLILSAVGAIRLESCNATFVSLGTLTMIAQIASGLVPIRTVYNAIVLSKKVDFKPVGPTSRKVARDELVTEMKEMKKHPDAEHAKRLEEAYNKANTLGQYEKPERNSDGAKVLNTHGELFAGFTHNNWWFCVIVWAEKSITAIFTSGVPGMSQTILNWIVCFLVWGVLCVRLPHTTVATNANMIANRTIQMFTLFFLMIGATTTVKPDDIAAVSTLFNVLGTAHLLVQQLLETAGKIAMIIKFAKSPDAAPIMKNLKAGVEKLGDSLDNLTKGSPKADRPETGLMKHDAAKAAKPSVKDMTKEEKGGALVGVSNYLASREL